MLLGHLAFGLTPEAWRLKLKPEAIGRSDILKKLIGRKTQSQGNLYYYTELGVSLSAIVASFLL